MLKPDSTRYSSVLQTRSSGPEWIESDFKETPAESSDVQPFRGREDLPTDVALDLRLYEILQQARLATAADGAVIALARGDKMVCRATLGNKAPSVGVCLNTRSGLAGACVQTREMQLCDDALVDPRVNAIACRDLGIRSIVALPVLDGRELWGLLEVFSSDPRAFSDSDLQALQSLGRKASHSVHEAIEGGSDVTAEFSPPPELASSRPENLEPDSAIASREPEVADIATVGRDYRTGALTVAVLTLAVFLGWMVGRVGWSLAVNRAPIQVPLTQEQVRSNAQVTAENRTASPTNQSSDNSRDNSQDNSTDTSKDNSKPVAKPAPPVAKAPPKPKRETTEPNGGLVVYEQGKVVFRMPPSGAQPPARVDPGVAVPGIIQKAATRKAATQEDDSSAAPAESLAPSTSSYLLQRVEPVYPEAALQQGIQGPVVLNALVGVDGSVRQLEVVSGDSQLIKAATDAVSQWRFNPHKLKGKAVEFETRVTVNFALPE